MKKPIPPPSIIIREGESPGVFDKLYKQFSKDARYEGGQYLIDSNGDILIADNPSDLMKLYKDHETKLSR